MLNIAILKTPCVMVKIQLIFKLLFKYILVTVYDIIITYLFDKSNILFNI